MTFDSIASTFTKLIDVLLVWCALYFILKNLRKNVKMVLLFKGILIIIVIKIISDWLNLVTIGYLLDYVFNLGTISFNCYIPT